jgi:type VI secretion system protein ImpK
MPLPLDAAPRPGRGGVGHPPSSPRRGLLALAVQETLTAVVRLRSGRQVGPDAETFRANVRDLLAEAERRAHADGYGGEDVKLALYAVVVFLDESVLQSAGGIFADWARRPLQEELFGDNTGGELFFRNLEYLLARPDGDAGGDVLEVYHLCLLLGFRGRYGLTDGGELRGLLVAVADKLRRIRGAPDPLAPSWAPPDEGVAAPRDPWVRPLAFAAAAAGLLAVVLLIVFWVTLRASDPSLAGIAAAP